MATYENAFIYPDYNESLKPGQNGFTNREDIFIDDAIKPVPGIPQTEREIPYVLNYTVYESDGIPYVINQYMSNLFQQNNFYNIAINERKTRKDRIQKGSGLKVSEGTKITGDFIMPNESNGHYVETTDSKGYASFRTSNTSHSADSAFFKFDKFGFFKEEEGFTHRYIVQGSDDIMYEQENYMILYKKFKYLLNIHVSKKEDKNSGFLIPSYGFTLTINFDKGEPEVFNMENRPIISLKNYTFKFDETRVPISITIEDNYTDDSNHPYYLKQEIKKIKWETPFSYFGYDEINYFETSFDMERDPQSIDYLGIQLYDKNFNDIENNRFDSNIIPLKNMRVSQYGMSEISSSVTDRDGYALVKVPHGYFVNSSSDMTFKISEYGIMNSETKGMDDYFDIGEKNKYVSVDKSKLKVYGKMFPEKVHGGDLYQIPIFMERNPEKLINYNDIINASASSHYKIFAGSNIPDNKKCIKYKNSDNSISDDICDFVYYMKGLRDPEIPEEKCIKFTSSKVLRTYPETFGKLKRNTNLLGYISSKIRSEIFPLSSSYIKIGPKDSYKSGFDGLTYDDSILFTEIGTYYDKDKEKNNFYMMGANEEATATNGDFLYQYVDTICRNGNYYDVFLRIPNKVTYICSFCNFNYEASGGSLPPEECPVCHSINSFYIDTANEGKVDNEFVYVITKKIIKEGISNDDTDKNTKKLIWVEGNYDSSVKNYDINIINNTKYNIGLDIVKEGGASVTKWSKGKQGWNIPKGKNIVNIKQREGGLLKIQPNGASSIWLNDRYFVSTLTNSGNKECNLCLIGNGISGTSSNLLPDSFDPSMKDLTLDTRSGEGPYFIEIRTDYENDRKYDLMITNISDKNIGVDLLGEDSSYLTGWSSSSSGWNFPKGATRIFKAKNGYTYTAAKNYGSVWFDEISYMTSIHLNKEESSEDGPSYDGDCYIIFKGDGVSDSENDTDNEGNIRYYNFKIDTTAGKGPYLIDVDYKMIK